VPPAVREAPVGAVYEWRTDNLALGIGQRVVRQGGAALIIDYGHTKSAAGETLQAVGGHAFVNALTSPGEVDLTAHVDFEAIALAAESMGARIHGPVDQARLLRNLGIDKRAAALKAYALPHKTEEIDEACQRLLGESRTGMGKLFKAIAISHPDIASMPGFE
jgi:SAM-dependent MidA family methyltransferase